MEGSGAGQYQEAEMTKNWDSHKFIAPLQSSIIHENYLLILPLASCDLRELLRKEVPPEYRADKRLAWQRLTNLLSALAHVHGDGKTIGYHLDIKPHNILVLKESGDWALTDFGQAHQKIKRTEHDISVTFRHQMATEYSAPGSTSRRSDVFSMGCIGCEIYLWLVDGPENGVVRFRNDRELTRDSVTEYKFWDEYENKLKEPVLKTLERIKNDPEHSRVGVVLESMLNLDGELRITSEAAGKDLADAIEGVYTVPMNPRDGLSPVAVCTRTICVSCNLTVIIAIEEAFIGTPAN